MFIMFWKEIVCTNSVVQCDCLAKCFCLWGRNLDQICSKSQWVLLFVIIDIITITIIIN